MSNTTQTPTAHQIFTEMKTYGGSFTKALAEAWFAADPENKSRIEREFTDYMEHYATFVQ